MLSFHFLPVNVLTRSFQQIQSDLLFRYYKVVGVLEKKKESDYLLSTLISRFFHGLVDLGPSKDQRKQSKIEKEP